jgi:hypothetical protein
VVRVKKACRKNERRVKHAPTLHHLATLPIRITSTGKKYCLPSTTPQDLHIYGVWRFIDGRQTSTRRGLRNVFLGKADWDRTMNRFREKSDELRFWFTSWLYISDWLEMGGLGWS